MDKLKLYGIKCKNLYYITVEELLCNEDSYTYLSNYLNIEKTFINDELPKKSFHKHWVIVKGEPKKIQTLVSQSNINYRYELIDSNLASDKIPLILKCEDVLEEDSKYYDPIWKEDYKTYESLYELKYDSQPDKLEDREFEFTLLIEIDHIDPLDSFQYSVEKTNDKTNTIITDENINYQIIDKIIFPDFLLHLRPCNLTSHDSYRIVRQYVKEHIDGNVATITSDYDFCFTVKKLIPLAKTKKYTVDVNNNIFQKRKRKPKYVTKQEKHRTEVCFEMAPKSYNNCPVISGFSGKNQKDLKKNIDRYCKDLIDFINKPLKECPHCDGYGVIWENRK